MSYIINALSILLTMTELNIEFLIKEDEWDEEDESDEDDEDDQSDENDQDGTPF